MFVQVEIEVASTNCLTKYLFLKVCFQKLYQMLSGYKLVILCAGPLFYSTGLPVYCYAR